MGEGFDSFTRRSETSVSAEISSAPLSDSIEQAEVVAGVAGPIVKGMGLISQLLDKQKGLKKGIEWSAKAIRVASVVAAQLAANPATDVEASLRTLNSVAGQARAERIDDSMRALVSEHGPNEMQFEQFLDAVQKPLAKIHERFDYASLPLDDPRRLALTIAFANVFWDDEQNEISRLGIESNPEYRKRLADVVGMNFWLDEVAEQFGIETEDSYGKQVPLDDIDENDMPIPMPIRDAQKEFTRSDREWAFAKHLLEIRKSPEYHELRVVVRDSGIYDAFEELIKPTSTKEEREKAKQKLDPHLHLIFRDSLLPFDAVIRGKAA